LVVEAATASWASGWLAGVGVAFALALVEHWVFDPFLTSRAFKADARALTEEVVVTAWFWVVIRTQQAFLNDYARQQTEGDVEGVDLIPLLLKRPPPAD
jgi:hypothetical protein